MHHAKAPSAGSTEGSGNSRGLFRRAFATRGASSSATGTVANRTSAPATPAAGESGPDSTAPTIPSRGAVIAASPHGTARPATPTSTTHRTTTKESK